MINIDKYLMHNNFFCHYFFSIKEHYRATARVFGTTGNLEQKIKR